MKTHRTPKAPLHGLRRVLCSLLLALPVLGLAQSWPNKPIKWIIPYPPGGITDSATRMLVQKVQEQTNWSIVIDNKAGANSILGAEFVARSAPDGYTFLTVIGAHAANATLYAGRLPFDVVKSFVPVSLVGIAPLLMTASPTLAVKDVRELIAYAKQNPGKLSFGSSGVGAAAHLTQELLKQVAGIDMVHVPYKGTAPAMNDLIAGNIQILTDTPSALMPQVRAGKIKALAVFSPKRVPGTLEVPTIQEAGGPAIEGSTWVLFLAPANTPLEIVNKMSQEVAKAVKSNDMLARFEGLGIEAVGSTPEEASKFLSDEIVKWARVISSANVKAE